MRPGSKNEGEDSSTLLRHAAGGGGGVGGWGGGTLEGGRPTAFSALPEPSDLEGEE